MSVLIFVSTLPVMVKAQTKSNYLRIARIVVKPEKLEEYKNALTEGVQTALKEEPGVLMLQAVYEKNNPTHITVFENYANVEAYQLHIQTAHFKKYKTIVADMVISLELTDVAPITIIDKQSLIKM